MAKAMFPKDAGLFLHCITGFEERTCYRYASGERKPPAFFLLALLRSEHGGPILSYLMQDCSAPWWRELQNARELCAKFKVEPR